MAVETNHLQGEESPELSEILRKVNFTDCLGYETALFSRYQRFGKICFLHLQGRSLDIVMLEEACSSQTVQTSATVHTTLSHKTINLARVKISVIQQAKKSFASMEP
jgi:hypothetical protein